MPGCRLAPQRCSIALIAAALPPRALRCAHASQLWLLQVPVHFPHILPGVWKVAATITGCCRGPLPCDTAGVGFMGRLLSR